MEIRHEEAPAIRPMKSDNDEAESVMGVTLTPQLYRMLSSGVYQNNVRAILREYLCNAYDAHVEAGTLDKAIDIYLPNTIEPYFKVRDYGTGLSEEGIRNIFGSYGNSTKTKSNDQIGCFGIGSKSAFSYTDQFMVVSYYKDTKRTYTCFLENGMPKVRLMTTEDTDEPNGLEISFPVMDPADFRRFLSEAAFVLKPFKAQGVLYRIFGVQSGFEVLDYRRQVEGTNWFLSTDISGGLVVRMGLVDYVVDTHQLSLSYMVKVLASKGVCLILPVGSVQPTPSRENLQIEDRTRQALNDACDVVALEMIAKAQQAIDAQPTMQAARKAWVDLVAGYRSPYHDLQDRVKATWRGRKLYLQVRPSHYGFEVVEMHRQPSWSSTAVRSTVVRDLRLTDIDLTGKLVWEDYPSGEFRVKAWLSHFANQGDILYLVRPVKTQMLYEVGKGKPMDLQAMGRSEARLPRGRDMKRFFEALGLGWKAFRMASSFPKKEREKPVRKNKGPDPNSKIFRLLHGRSGGSAWEAAEVDITQGGYYIPIRHWKAQVEVTDSTGNKVTTAVKPEELVEPVNAAAHFLRLNDIPVYGVNKDSVIKRMQKEGNWKNVMDLLTETFWEMAKFDKDDEYWEKDWVKHNIIEFSTFDNLMYSGVRNRHRTLLNFLPGTHQGPITDMCHAVYAVNEWLHDHKPTFNSYTRDGTFVHLRRFLINLRVPGVRECTTGLWGATSPRYDNLDVMIETMRQKYNIPNLFKAYPMLEDVSCTTGSTDRAKRFADYVMMVDKFRSCECECK